MPYRAVNRTALAKLTSAPWRGNVRELENTLHRAVLLAQGNEIGADAIELLGGAARPEPTMAGARTVTTEGSVSGLVGRRMEEVERDLIIETLHHTLGNRTHAATILGISIRALRNKLREYSAQGTDVPPVAGAMA
jgi:DNA-binding NtrC family response regulator